MSEYEKDLRKMFDLPEEGRLCDACIRKFTNKMLINKALEMNAIAQAKIGTESNSEDRAAAYYVARHAKEAIANIDIKFAESTFPEIDLNSLPPAAYLGEKL